MCISRSFQDTNDNAPVFSQLVYTVSVYENATAGTPIADVVAADADRTPFNNLLAYRIADVQDKFTIDSQSGQIVLAYGASLGKLEMVLIGKQAFEEIFTSDRDSTKKDHYRLTIVAVDQGVPAQSGRAIVEINVLDINDKPPKFPERHYTISVYENAPVGTFLINVTARDTDADAKLIYKFVGYSEAKTDDGAKVDISK